MIIIKGLKFNRFYWLNILFIYRKNFDHVEYIKSCTIGPGPQPSLEDPCSTLGYTDIINPSPQQQCLIWAHCYSTNPAEIFLSMETKVY